MLSAEERLKRWLPYEHSNGWLGAAARVIVPQLERDVAFASADRSPEGGDHEDGRHAKHESAVGAAETPNTGQGTSHG